MFELKRKRTETKHELMRIGLLGATFDTGNMGVSALAESSIKIILHHWPDCKIVLLGMGWEPGQYRVKVWGREVAIKTLPIRFCKNVFIKNHFIVLCLYALLFKIFRWEKFKRFCTRRNVSLHCITQMDMVADITGGDSFSDIYGMRRFVMSFLCKWLVLLFGIDLVMLPQTYGPFKRRLAKAMARYILKRASLVYSRDRAGVEYVKKVLKDPQNGKVRFIPDVAFVLDSHKPEHLGIEPSADIRSHNSIVIGLNISGLLFNGGYTRNNMFGLKSNYRESIYAVLEMLLRDRDVVILLVPHVFPQTGYEVESDPDACLSIYEQFKIKYPGRIFLAKGEYDQGEIKYIIGLCDFFIGSRMHACIAALSQGIPAVGIAYSKKFRGVFESLYVENLAIDMRKNSIDQILITLSKIFIKRNVTREHLKNITPEIRRKVLNIFLD